MSVVSLVVVGLSWFSSSALFSTWANTTFLLFFRDPLLHTFIRFLGSAVIGFLTLISTGEVVVSELPIMLKKLLVPALLLWLANFANSISLQLAGITLTYVVKACIPVFTVIVCTLQGQKFPIMIYVSLIPICLGVILASGSDLDFSIYGLSAALVSALAQTFMNISIKSVRASTGYSGQKAFLGMTIVATVQTIPVVVALSLLNSDAQAVTTVDRIYDISSKLREGDSWPLLLTTLAALAYHIEYLLNFVFVGYVTAVAFSVSDIARRIAIIVTGAVVFNKTLTMQNWMGIAVALGGVLWYSYLESKTTKSATPAVSSSATSSSAADSDSKVSGSTSRARNHKTISGVGK